MSQQHFFISYSTAEAQEFAVKLHDEMEAGHPKIEAWLDKRDLRPAEDWDTQIDDAIRDCGALLFVMTPDSVMNNSVCKLEWSRALSYKKAVIPIYLQDCDTPFRMQNRQYIDFTDFGKGIAELRKYLAWVNSPAGELKRMQDELLDMQRQLSRAPNSEEARIKKAMTLLEERITEQEFVVKNPEEAAKRTEDSVKAGIERARQPADKPKSGTIFINHAPATVPSYFQDRVHETKMLAQFLEDDHRRIFHLVGRAGIGKTAVTVRLLKHLEAGKLPDGNGEMSVDGIVYLRYIGSHGLKVQYLYPDLCRLLPDKVSKKLNTLYHESTTSITDKMTALLSHFRPDKRVLVLLDGFEDVVNPETQAITDSELDEALKALVDAPPHGVKVLITTHVLASKLFLHQTHHQQRHVLDHGLESPYAEDMLKLMDDGTLNLKDAPPETLSEAADKVRRYPRALEALVGWLEVDFSASLDEVLNFAEGTLPDNVVKVLVGQAFNRLDKSAQQIVQALAIFGRPVSSGAIDALLKPYTSGINCTPILRRLLNWHFVRQEGSLYSLHPVDREYALSLIPRGEDSDRFEMSIPPFTQIALFNLGADYFKSLRKPHEEWEIIADLDPQLIEFDLRCNANDWDTAARVLIEFNFNYLFLWDYYKLMIERYERLQGKIVNKLLQSESMGKLGMAYYSIGNAFKSIKYCEQALIIAREINDKEAEGECLGNLGLAHHNLSDVETAIDYYQEAFTIAHDIEDYQREARHLGNLGAIYRDLGNVDKAIEYCKQSITIRREIEDKSGESLNLKNFGHVMLDKGDFVVAEQNYQEAIEIADRIRFNQSRHETRCGLALLQLYQSDLAHARETIELALGYDVPRNNHNAHVAYGIITLRQGDKVTARDSFDNALSACNEILFQTSNYYRAKDAKGLALCGLALLDNDPSKIEEAKAIFHSVQTKTKNLKGHIRHIQRQFDALAVVDSDGLLVGVR